MCDFYGYKLRLLPSVFEPGPENVAADANTKLADKRSIEFCRLNMGVTQIPKRFREAVL